MTSIIFRIWLSALLSGVFGVLCAVAAAQPGSAAEPSREPRVALVIGNASYKGAGALKNPENDARDMARQLERLGFDVILRINATQREMYRAITEFGTRISRGGVALFFYAGHGIQARGRNFLLPIDAQVASELSLRSEGVDVDQLLAQLAPARVSLVILDACRNNPFERGFRGTAGNGLAQIDAPKGTLIAYSTAPGRVAADGEGRNSPYSGELLRALSREQRRVEDVFKEVRVNVARLTADQQIPWESSSLTGEMLIGLPRPGGPPVASPSEPAAPASAEPSAGAFELAFWNSIQDSRNAAEYRAYLDQFPNGRFAALARARIDRFAASRAPAQAIAAPAQPTAPSPQATAASAPAPASVPAAAPATAATAPAAPGPTAAQVALASPASGADVAPVTEIVLPGGKSLRLPASGRWSVVSRARRPVNGSTVTFHRFPDSYVRRGHAAETVVSGELGPGIAANLSITAPEGGFEGVISWDAPRCPSETAAFAERFDRDVHLPECLYLSETRDAQDTPIYEIGYHRYVLERFVRIVVHAPVAAWPDRPAAIAWAKRVADAARTLLGNGAESVALPAP